MQGSIKKKVKECKRVIIACLLPCCHQQSGKDLIWMWQNKGPLVLISVWTVLEFLSLSLVSVRSFVICPWPFSEQGVLNRDGQACLLQSHLLTVRIGLRIWWVLRVWLGNCSLVESTPMNDNQSSPWERGVQPLSFGSWLVIQCPSSPEWQRWLVRTCWSEQAFQEMAWKCFCSQKEDRLFKTVLEWTFETHQAFSLPSLPPGIPGDPRSERRNLARCFLWLSLEHT